MKTTRWFKSPLHPERIGVYEVNNGDSMRWSYWQGTRWCGCYSRHEYAVYSKYDPHGGLPVMEWRGLAKKP